MMTNSIPKRLGEFEIIGEIGRGSMTAVYEAVDTTLDRNDFVQRRRKCSDPNWNCWSGRP